jgi:hypothetical protein
VKQNGRSRKEKEILLLQEEGKEGKGSSKKEKIGLG